MATCPNCNKHIDDDSYYCEHCGTKLYACPKCHTIGKGEGKRCGQCGTKLVEASSIGQNAPQQQPPQPAVQQPPQPAVQQPPQSAVQQPNSFATSQAPVTSPGAVGSSIPPTSAQQTPAGAANPAADAYNAPQVQGTAISSPTTPSSLFCAAMNIRLPLIEGALIGRTTGNYVQQLSVCKYISGRHAVLNNTPTGWTITDLGSTNGTKVNGIPCAPTLPFSVGSIVRMGNFYNFVAE